MTLLDSGTRMARKPHRCDWCGERIDAGNRYRYCVGIWYGEFGRSKFHPECAAAGSEEDFGNGFEPYTNERPFIADYIIQPEPTVKKFAKLFDTPTGQIVFVCRDDGADDGPYTIQMMFKPPSEILSVCDSTVGYKSERKRDKYFNKIDAAEAETLLIDLHKMMVSMTGESA